MSPNLHEIRGVYLEIFINFKFIFLRFIFHQCFELLLFLEEFFKCAHENSIRHSFSQGIYSIHSCKLLSVEDIEK